MYSLSWSRFARLLVKKSGCQNATPRADEHEQGDEHVARPGC